MQENVPVFVTPDTLVDTYISRPVSIRAVPWDGTEQAAAGITAWVDSHQGEGSTTYEEGTDGGPGRILVGTLGGNTELTAGSWLIQSAEGDFSVCKDPVFARRYALPVTPLDAANIVDSALLMSSTDAAVWAAEFAKVHPEMDEGFMIGWFASAIETAKQAARG